MKRYRYLPFAMLALIAMPQPPAAQENMEFSGKWAQISKGTMAQGRCGRELVLAELEVTGVVADAERPTYNALVTAWKSSERCLKVSKETSKAKLVVRGTRVSLSYEAEGWGSEMLVRDGQTMSGIDENGDTLEWQQPGELPLSLQTNMVRQNIINHTSESRIEELKAELVAGGKSAEEAEQMAPKLVEGFADCIVSIAQIQAAVQRLPYDELLKIYDPVPGDEANPRVVKRLDRTSVEVRTRACFYDVGEALGAQIM